MIRISLLAIALATPCFAQTPLSPKNFEDRVLGKTIQYTVEGERVGAEQYLEDRNVIWQTPDGDCDKGRWYPQNGAICYIWESDPEPPQCYELTLDDRTLVFRYLDEPDDPPFRSALESRIPLSCVGPELGA